MTTYATLDEMLRRESREIDLPNGEKARVQTISVEERRQARKAASQHGEEQGLKDDAGEFWDPLYYMASMIAHAFVQPAIPQDRVPQLLRDLTPDAIAEIYTSVTASEGADDPVSEFPADDTEGADSDVPASTGEVLAHAGSEDAGSSTD